MSKRYVAPSVSVNSFSCPHCGALAHQTWHKLFALPLKDNGTPFIPDQEIVLEMRDSPYSAEDKQEFFEWSEKMDRKEPFLHQESNSIFTNVLVDNAWVSSCYSCKRLAVWLHDRIIFPPERYGEEPNPDLPNEIQLDFEEARTVLNHSPRAAAAILRLCIEKLCKEVGDPKRTIDQNIGFLVQSGLDARVQEALDVVRVIGNEAVHPGQIDLRDDREMASRLFGLVNYIAHHVITHPKQVKELFGSLPTSKLEAIARRDGRS